jgi:putative membrane protein
METQIAPLIAQEALRGFLPTRATFMLDFVFLAMFAVLPLLMASVYLVKGLRRYEAHKRLQIVLAAVLLVAVAAFEIDLNFFTRDWRPLAEPSPYYASKGVDYSLWVHLAFAVPTPLLWLLVIVRAVRKFPRPAAPGTHSRSHARWAWLATAGMGLTAITGWIFYWLAFVA